MLLDAALADRLAVVVQGDVAALGQTAAVVGEFHPDLVLAGGDGLVGGDDVVLDAEEVVAVLQPALVGVERPAADAAALGDDDAVGARLWHDDVGGHRVRLVLQVEYAVLADPHPGEQQLAVAADQLRTAGDVGIDALEAAVIERHDVVFDGLDEPEPLQLGQFLGILCARLCAWVQSSGPYSSQTSSSKAAARRSSTACGAW